MGNIIEVLIFLISLCCLFRINLRDIFIVIIVRKHKK